MDSDDEEIEFSIFVNFGSHFPFDDFLDPATQMKIIGLDTESPIAEVNGRFYQGEYERALGTKLFFAPSGEERRETDEWFGKKNLSEPYAFVDKTDKVLNMKRIFVTSKDELKKETVVKEEKNEEKYKVQTTYSDALNKFLPEFREPPRKITAEENGNDLVRRSQEMESD